MTFLSVPSKLHSKAGYAFFKKGEPLRFPASLRKIDVGSGYQYKFEVVFPISEVKKIGPKI